MSGVVREQGAARARLARTRRVAEPPREAVEVAAFVVEVGDRAVLDDAQAQREAFEELPSCDQRSRLRLRECAALRELREDVLGAIDFEDLRMLVCLAELEPGDDGFDVELWS